MIITLLIILIVYIIYSGIASIYLGRRLCKKYNISSEDAIEYITGRLSDKIWGSALTFCLYSCKTIDQKIINAALIYSHNKNNPIKIFTGSLNEYEKITGSSFAVMQSNEIEVNSDGIIQSESSFPGCVAIINARNQEYSVYPNMDSNETVTKVKYFGFPIKPLEKVTV